jgi:VWFA-related protein
MRSPTLHRIALCGLLGTAVAAQQPQRPAAPDQPVPPVTFKVEINYVEVDAIVTDRQGTFVRNLQRSDFQILEDGKPQSISAFALVDIPIEREERPLFASQPIEPDVKTNARPFDGRVYVLLLDDLHVHPLRSGRVRTAAKKFIEQNLGANDVAAVVYTSGRTDVGQEFTSNRRLLAASVDKFMGRKLRSSTLNRIDEYFNTRDTRAAGDRVDDPEEAERGYQARNSLGAVKSVSEFLAGIRGRRKALLFISEGIDYDITDIFNNRSAASVIDEAREAVAAATRSNVSVYAVDPRGLTAGGDDAIEMQALPDDTTLGLGMTSLWNEVRLAHDSLRTLADETGGLAVLNSNDFTDGFSRIVRDNSSYYVLGYYPTNDRRDGRFRKIEVKLARPDLTVRARRGYVAPRGRPAADRRAESSAGTSAELREVMQNPLSVPGLTMAVFAAPFLGPAPKASVLIGIQVRGQDLTFAPREGLHHNTLELAYVAVDQNGKVQASDRHQVDLRLKPDTFKAVERSGFRVTARAEMPPGRYQLRVGARETGGGAVGSVHYDFEVPDFGKSSLAVSGLVVTSAAAKLTPTARPDAQLQEVLDGPPTAAREFASDDQLAVFAEVYDNVTSPPHKVDITTAVLSDEGRVMFETAEERSSEELKGARGGYGHVARIPLRELQPGLYVLRVEAKSRLGNDEPVRRDVQFRVRQPASGGPDSPGAAGDPAAAGSAGVMTTIARGSTSGITGHTEIVARTQAEWEALWKQHAPDRPAPTVDFTRHAVAAVFLGSQPTAGYSVRIASAKQTGEGLELEFLVGRPASDAIVAQVVTSPFHIVTVPASPTIAFRRVDPSAP